MQRMKSEPPRAGTQLERAKECVRVLVRSPRDLIALELLDLVIVEAQDTERRDGTIEPDVWFALDKFNSSLKHIEQACFAVEKALADT